MAGQHGEVMQSPIPVQQAYDLAAPFYDNWYWQEFWRSTEYPLIRGVIERVRRGRGKGFAVLDVGCGTGWYLQQLGFLGAHLEGVDLSSGMLAIARHRLPAVALQQADIRRLPYAGNRFDAVICTRVLSHLPRLEEAVSEMRRVLAPGGTLVLSEVDAAHDYQYTRLPVSAGHVFANTYKHDRTTVYASVEKAGFVPNTSFIVHLDGNVENIQKRGVRQTKSPTASWIGAWRKSI